LFSLAWWVCIALVVPGPPATATLFAMADPRRHSSVPEWGDAVATFRGAFLRSWAVVLWTIPLVLILLWNLFFFGGTDQRLAFLAPLWALMILFLLVLTTYAMAVLGALDTGVKDTFRAAGFLLIGRPLTSLALLLFFVALLLVLTLLVVPLILLGPGLSASIINRFVLAGLDIEVLDPNAPTPERSMERREGRDVRGGLFERARRGGSGR